MYNDQFKAYFPLHLDSGNRGCEAIAKGTINIFGFAPKQYIGLDTNIQLDADFGLNQIADLIPHKKRNFFKKVILYLGRKLTKNSYKWVERYHKDIYSWFLDLMNKNDICFITGGDLLCYGDNQINYIVNELTRRNIKKVLWGASVDKETITVNQKNILSKFDVITARESITCDFLKNEIGLNNVELFPDPAFILPPQKFKLPNYFSSNVIGINLSNFVKGNIDNNSIFMRSLKKMFDYVIKNTDYNIVLIPHVFWNGQDDRIVCKNIYDSYKNTGKVFYLDTEKLNYCQIRYAISKCELFIGARTHSVISAYSIGIPSLALGYSVKSKGIAKDLRLPAETVVNYKNIQDINELVDRFVFLEKNKAELRQHLFSIMPEYANKAYEAKNYIYKHLKGENYD